MGHTELSNKVQELRELRRMAADLTTEIEALQDTIKAHMSAQGLDTVTGSDFKITWTEVESRRFDKQAMISMFGQECYDRFCRTSKTRRFVVA